MGDWIPLLVRREDYPELAALVAQREIGRPDRALGSIVSTEPSAAPEPAVDDAVAEALQLTPVERAEMEELDKLAPWTDADLLRLATSPVLAAHRWRMVIDACAAQPGRFFPEDRIVPLTGARAEEWSDILSAMGRFLDTHFPDVPGRPLVTVDGPTIHRDDQVWWAASEEQAHRWRQIRSSLPQPRRPRHPLPVASALD